MTMMRAAARIHQARPDCRFLVACFRAHHQQMVDEYLRKHPGLPIETHVGRTPRKSFGWPIPALPFLGR